MIKSYFQIAGLIIELNSEQPLEIDLDFKPFQIYKTDYVDWIAIYRQVDTLKDYHKTLVARAYDHEVYAIDDSSFIRGFHLVENENIYALSYFNNSTEAVIHYLDCGKSVVKKIHQCFRMSCWEAAMNRHKRLLLHASLISTKYGGILFAGPSGIGKSTQASLWQNHRGARLINGDRPILYKKENWIACGSPLAGSSRCCLNESVQVSVIVLLKQASECSIQRVDYADAFKRLYSLSTVYSWSTEYVERVLNLIQELISEIPVYELSCTPDEKAIATLERVLQGDASYETI